jgi:O-methyltransferase involved in polyketide biosynthesis
VESLADALGRSAYDPSRAAFFAWLGVTGYLTRPAVEATLRAIRSLAPPGSVLVFDYLDAIAFVPAHQSLALQLRFERARAVGEPYVTGFAPEELARLLGALGYALVEDLGQPEQTARYFRGRADGIRPAGYWHWVHARLV